MKRKRTRKWTGRNPEIPTAIEGVAPQLSLVLLDTV